MQSDKYVVYLCNIIKRMSDKKLCKILNDSNMGTLVVDGVGIVFNVHKENDKYASIEYFKEHYLSLGYTVENHDFSDGKTNVTILKPKKIT